MDLKFLIAILIVFLMIIIIILISKKRKESTPEDIFFDELRNDYQIIKDQMLKKIIKDESFNSRELYKNNYSKSAEEIGKLYEELVAQIFERLNYKIDKRGQRLGKEDKGIDIVAENDDEIYLIQCKYYKSSTKINHTMIKEFSANAKAFIIRERIQKKDIKIVLVIPNEESLEKSAIEVLKDKSFNVNKLIIKY